MRGRRVIAGGSRGGENGESGRGMSFPKTMFSAVLQLIDFSAFASRPRAFPKPLGSGMREFSFRIARNPLSAVLRA